MTEEQAKKFNANRITHLCEKHGCSDKKRKLHFDQMVHRAWNPHPSLEFVEWWHTQLEFQRDHVDPVRARNCKAFTERFKEAVGFGGAMFPTDYPA